MACLRVRRLVTRLSEAAIIIKSIPVTDLILTHGRNTMKRSLVLAVILFVTSGLLAKDPDPKRWEAAIAKFQQQDRARPTAPGAVVFTGSSSIALWRDLDKHFPDQVVLNRGFGGSTLPDVNHYLDQVVLKHRPRIVVLFCGGNDMAAHDRSPQEVLADFETFRQRIHAELPRTKIVYLSIHLPPGRLAQRDKIQEANRLIAAACGKHEGCTFVNVHELMLGADGNPNPDLYADKLHPNARAYQLWAEKLRPVLR